MLPEFFSIFKKSRSRFSEISQSNHEGVEDSPMIGYLILFEKQHKTILLLYRGLIFIFAGFFLVVSIFAYRSFESLEIPDWGLFFLILIDLLLLGGFWKGLVELRRYQKKSRIVLEKINDQLSKDLKQIKFLKVRHKNSSVAPRKKVAEHKGWDIKTCRHCGTNLELLTKECPACHRMQADILPS